MKKIVGILIILTLFFGSFCQVFAAEKDDVIKSMESDQSDIKVAFESIEAQVNALSKTSTRREDALAALEAAKNSVDAFIDLTADEHVAGAPQNLHADDAFVSAQKAANEAIIDVRRVIISPDRPGVVPKGDIISDFIPQVVRQLFRFAWVAIFIAFTVSGIMLIIAHDNDELITKAKGMIYYTLIGFAFITLAFAIVKAVTDIDFFGFI